MTDQPGPQKRQSAGHRVEVAFAVIFGLLALTGLCFWLFVDWGLGNGRHPGEDYAPLQIGLFVAALIVLTIGGVLLSGISASVVGIVPVVVLGFVHEFTAPRPEGYNDGLWMIGVGMIAIGTMLGVLFVGSLARLVRQYRDLGRSSRERRKDG